MKRQRLKKRQDKKVYRATAKVHPKNSVRYVMRGGIRF